MCVEDHVTIVVYPVFVSFLISDNADITTYIHAVFDRITSLSLDRARDDEEYIHARRGLRPLF